MKDISYTAVDYCMYDYPIKKPTLIFHNFLLELKCCDKSHTHTNWDDVKSRKSERSVIPNNLCLEIASAIL
jgi:hypothetical protein